MAESMHEIVNAENKTLLQVQDDFCFLAQNFINEFQIVMRLQEPPVVV